MSCTSEGALDATLYDAQDAEACLIRLALLGGRDAHAQGEIPERFPDPTSVPGEYRNSDSRLVLLPLRVPATDVGEEVLIDSKVRRHATTAFHRAMWVWCGPVPLKVLSVCVFLAEF